MPAKPGRSTRHKAQTVALFFAVLSYLAAVGAALAAFMHDGELPADPIRASLMASVVFFVGCGVVLHVIGTARLSGILSATHPDQDH